MRSCTGFGLIPVRRDTPVIMKTLQDHLDDLDRMVDTGHATKDAVRSQIAFIGREIAALQADYARLAQTLAKLQEAHTKLQEAQARELARRNEEFRQQALHSQELDANPTFEPEEFPRDRNA